MWYYVMFPLKTKLVEIQYLKDPFDRFVHANGIMKSRLDDIKEFESELREIGFLINPQNAYNHIHHSYWLINLQEKKVFFLKTRDNNAKLISMNEFRHLCRGTIVAKKFSL